MSKYIIQFDNLMNYPAGAIPNDALIEMIVAIYNNQNEWVILDNDKSREQKNLEKQVSEIIVDFGKNMTKIHSDMCQSLWDILEGDIPGPMQTKLRNIQNMLKHLNDKEIIDMTIQKITV